MIQIQSNVIALLWNHKEEAGAPVFRSVDNVIRWINLYPMDSAVRVNNNYPLDSYLYFG